MVGGFVNGAAPGEAVKEEAFGSAPSSLFLKMRKQMEYSQGCDTIKVTGMV